MRNITKYNEFKKFKINEADSGSYGKGATKVGGDSDAYFANVKGNLAGAENTLIGSAFLKLFGFIKRKGMQIYMQKVLKPKLGRVYMNGILRYALKNGIGNFARKTQFAISKVLEDGNTEKIEQTVSFELDNVNGLSVFKEDANVIKKDGTLLEDGNYLLMINDTNFECKNGKIININGKVSNDGIKKPNIQSSEITGEYSVLKKKYKEEIQEAEKEGIKPEQWVIDESNKITNTINQNIDTLDNKDFDMLSKESNSIKRTINLLEKGIDEINNLLKKDNISNRDVIKRDKLQYQANILELEKLGDFINTIIKNQKSKKIQKKPPILVEMYISEKKDIKSGKVGDELQEIINSGDAIDLNDESFYKQFEDENNRKGVTQEILKNKSDIVKIQLAADRIISGNEKQENAWKQMVENVKSMYSKYFITDLVDPYVVKKSSSESDINKWEQENESKSGIIKSINGIKKDIDIEKNNKFKDNTIKLSSLDKNFDDGMIGIINVNIKKTDLYLIIRRVEKIDNLVYYRIIGTIDYDKISNYDGDNFHSLVKINNIPNILLPKLNEQKLDANGNMLKATYIVTKGVLGIGGNNISLLYLFSGTKDVDFTKENTFYKIKNFKTDTELKLPSASSLSGYNKLYLTSLYLDRNGLYRIKYTQMFMENEPKTYKLSDNNSKEKMMYINTLFEKK